MIRLMDFKESTMNTMPYVVPSRVPSNADGLSSYISYAKSIPILSAEEEKVLFERFQSENDLEAARSIILSHLRFVVYIAKSYAGYGIPIEDLIQEGNIGLMKSVKRFELSHGVRLASFAVHWIKSEIHEYVLKNWRLVKVATTKAQRKLFFNLRKAKKNLGWLTKAEAEQIAQELNVKTNEVFEMESRLIQKDVFFDPSYGDRVDHEDCTLSAKALHLEDHSTRPDLICEYDEHRSDSIEALREAISTLDERSQDIINSRWFSEKKVSLKVLANKYGVSMERIRQIEASAIKKLKKSLPETISV